MCHHSARKGNIGESWGSLATALSQWALGSQKVLSPKNKEDSNKVRYLKLTFVFYTHALYINLHIHVHKQVHTQTRYNINLCWLVLCLVHTTRINWDYKWRNFSTRLICGQDCGTFSGLMNDEKAQVTISYATFGLMVFNVLRM